MTFLPIVERELRVRSRLAWTYYLRCLAAGIALVPGTILLSELLLGPGRTAVGQSLLYGLSVLAFLGCVLEGARAGADALSKERREGTLGLLFLTNLNAYDVVLGKLTAASLHAFYGLAAMIPVLALPLLAGGVTGAELGRIGLGLVNTLFLTLSAGLWVSARSRDEQRAWFGTLGLVAAAAGGLPLADLWLRGGSYDLTEPWVSLASPAVSCFLAVETFYQAAPKAFWWSLGLTHGIAWLLLVLTGATLRTVIRGEERLPLMGLEATREEAAREAILQSRAVRERRCLETKPLVWLRGRQRGLSACIWLLLVLGVLTGYWLQLVLALWRPARALASPYWLIGIWDVAVMLALRLALAAIACRFFVQARNGGFLELLLTAPVSRREIVGSQWEALRRYWLWPTMLVTLGHGLSLLALVYARGEPLPASLQLHYSVSFASQVLTALGDFFAVGWVGMWLAYSSRKPGLAVMRTFVLVILLPYLFCSGFPVNVIAYRLGIMVVPYAFAPAIVTLLKDFAFIVWARNRLREEFTGERVQSAVRRIASRERPM